MCLHDLMNGFVHPSKILVHDCSFMSLSQKLTIISQITTIEYQRIFHAGMWGNTLRKPPIFDRYVLSTRVEYGIISREYVVGEWRFNFHLTHYCVSKLI